MADLDLLKQYAQARSEAAFAELDVAQGVFIALAQQAKSLHRDQPLSPLLAVAMGGAVVAAQTQPSPMTSQ